MQRFIVDLKLSDELTHLPLTEPELRRALRRSLPAGVRIRVQELLPPGMERAE